MLNPTPRPPRLETIEIPYYLTWDRSRSDSRGQAACKPGRGDAGWTVARVPSTDAVLFLESLPREAWMPGTKRLAVSLGVQS